MKILFFARRFYPLIGGVETHVLELSQRLVKKGHRVIIVTEQTGKLPRFERIYPRGLELEIYRINVGVDNRFKKFSIWKEVWKLRGLIKVADVVHCHDVFFWYAPFRFFYPNKPVYTTFHGYESFPISKKAIIIRKISEKLSWGNICIGDFIPKWYGTRATYVSYGAVQVATKNLELRTKNKFKKESAAFVGRLDDQTGILTYIKTVELIRKSYPQFSLVAVGDGEYKNKIAKKVKVVGFQKNPEKYLMDSHFAFVSRYLAMLEAFAGKRLVFAVYDNPVKEDYVRMAPFAKFVIVENNPQKLAERVLYFLKHPEAEKKLVEKAYSWVQKQTWEHMSDLYLKLWKK